METVAAAMTPDPIHVSEWEPLDRCARRMETLRIRHLPVTAADGSLLGLLDRPEVDRLLTRPGGSDRSAGEVARSVSTLAALDEPLDTVLRRLRDAEHDILVVVDEDERLQGVITEHDLARLAGGLLGDTPVAHRRADHPLYAIPPDASTTDALRFFARDGVHHLVVLEDHTLVAVLSKRDLDRLGPPPGEGWTVRDLVGGQTVETALEGTPLRELAQAMAARRIGSVVILDPDDVPVDIVTRGDLVEPLLHAMRATSET